MMLAKTTNKRQRPLPTNQLAESADLAEMEAAWKASGRQPIRKTFDAWLRQRIKDANEMPKRDMLVRLGSIYTMAAMRGRLLQFETFLAEVEGGSESGSGSECKSKIERRQP